MIVILTYKKRDRVTEVETRYDKQKSVARRITKKTLKGDVYLRERSRLLKQGYVEYSTSKSTVRRFQTPDEKPYAPRGSTRTIAGMKGQRNARSSRWEFLFLAKGSSATISVQKLSYGFTPWRAAVDGEYLAKGSTLVEAVTKAKEVLQGHGFFALTPVEFVDDIVEEAKRQVQGF